MAQKFEDGAWVMYTPRPPYDTHSFSARVVGYYQGLYFLKDAGGGAQRASESQLRLS